MQIYYSKIIQIYTWIVSTESYGNPTTRRYANGVPFNRINKIKILRIRSCIVIPNSSTNLEEIESMKMNRMVLRCYDSGILQNQLNRGVVRQSINFGAVGGLQIGRRCAGKVIAVRRVRRKIGGEDPTDIEEMSLKKGRGWHHESDIVDAGHDSASVAGFAGGTGIDSQTDGEKQVVIDLQGYLSRIFLGIQALEGVGEVVSHLGSVDWRSLGGSGLGGGESTGVMKSGGGGDVVDRDGGVHESRGGDQVFAGVLIGGQEDVGGLARCDEDGVDLERLNV